MDANRAALENAFCMATYQLMCLNESIPVGKEARVLSDYMRVAKRCTDDQLKHYITMFTYLRIKVPAR